MARLEESAHATTIGTLVGHKSHVAAMAWSPDGKTLVSGSTDGCLNFWYDIAGETRARFTQERQGRRHTSLAWQHDSRLLACACEGAGLEIWNMRAVELEDIGESLAADARHVAWAPRTRWLAFGGESGKVHFVRDLDGKDEVRKETGVGHVWSIASMAWSPDGEVLATGTAGGTIGVWPVSAVDNQLRDGLTAPGRQSAHDDDVHSLAWSADTDKLASASKDGQLRLWNVNDGRLLATADLGEVLLNVTFALKGKMLVVQTLHQLLFLRCDPLVEVASFSFPSLLKPVRTTIALDTRSSRLATIDKDSHAISIWRVDFSGLLKAAEITKRTYGTAGVALLGEPGTGRTNLALTLAGDQFMAESKPHGFEVHRLRLDPVEPRPGEVEIRDVAFWDLPTGAGNNAVEDALVQRMHAGDELVRVIVLSPTSGSTVFDNVTEWKKTIRRYAQTVSPGGSTPILAVTRSDRLRSWPTDAEHAQVTADLGTKNIFFVSAREGRGVQQLKAQVLAAIDWNRAGSFESVEIFNYIRDFVTSERSRRSPMTTVQDLGRSFALLHDFLGPRAPSEASFRTAIRFLEMQGEVEIFEKRDELLLSPQYFHTYALAMIMAASKDPKGMGRLPLDEAELAMGPTLQIPEKLRITATPKGASPSPSRSQFLERRLAAATIDELERKGVAQRLSTDEKSYLVFPRSVRTSWNETLSEQDIERSCQVPCAADELFSSLVVRFLGLSEYFTDCKLWTNGAIFRAAQGGTCGVLLDDPEDGTAATLKVFFRDNAAATTRASFSNTVRKHVQERVRDVHWVVASPPAPAAGKVVEPGRFDHPEVFVCHHLRSDSQSNLSLILDQLGKRGIVLRPEEGKGGDIRQQRRLQLDTCQVAVVVLDGPPKPALRIEYDALVRRGCRIIPVVLPNSPKGFRVPDVLSKYAPVDFRDLTQEHVERLDRWIRQLWREALTSSTEVRVVPQRHVFLSYCRDDKGVVAELRRAFKKRGHVVWWDEDIEAGADWSRSIEVAMDESYAVVICFSRNVQARSKSGVYPEILKAVEIFRTIAPGRIFMIPVRLDACEIPLISIDSVRSLTSLQIYDFDGEIPKGKPLKALIAALDAARDAGV